MFSKSFMRQNYKKSRHKLQRLSKTDQTTENAILGYGVTWSSRLLDCPMKESITEAMKPSSLDLKPGRLSAI